MKKNHKSITQRLRRMTANEKREILKIWLVDWESEHFDLVGKLGVAIKDDNFDDMCINIGQLRALSKIKFSAIQNIINELTKNPE